MKTVLITGATSGIGKSLAKIFAQNKYRLILTGRRADRLSEVSDELLKLTEVTTLNFDVSNRTEVYNSIQSLPSNFKSIDILVNNAGGAYGRDSFQDADINDLDQMIDINFKGLLYVTKAVLPLMPKSHSSQIMNVGSIAGKEVYPNGNAYCAAKHAVDSLTQSMRIDLNATGIKVSAIHPGMVETEFSINRYKGDVDKAKKIYEGMVPLSANDVAETIYWMCSRPLHVNIADVVIFPSDQASATLVKRS